MSNSEKKIIPLSDKERRARLTKRSLSDRLLEPIIKMALVGVPVLIFWVVSYFVIGVTGLAGSWLSVVSFCTALLGYLALILYGYTSMRLERAEEILLKTCECGSTDWKTLSLEEPDGDWYSGRESVKVCSCRDCGAKRTFRHR